MATSEIIQRKGIILRQVIQKEQDAYLLALGPEGFFSFYAHGVKKMNSKLAGAVSLLAFADYTLRKSSSGALTAQEASNPELLAGKEGDLTSMAIASVLVEVTTRLVQEDEAAEVYPYLLNALNANRQGKDGYCAGLIYIAHCLKIMGFGLHVDSCVSCDSKKDIHAISFQEGGFLCDECAAELGVPPTPLYQLKLYRYIFRANAEDIGRVSIDSAVARSVYAALGQYIDQLTGVRLDSIEFLSHI